MNSPDGLAVEQPHGRRRPAAELVARGAEHIATLRVLDAAANRAREGLRVVEDYVRFVLDDRHLTQLCKQLRHDLTAALSADPGRQRLAARETQADVGTGLTTAAEQSRTDAAEVLRGQFRPLAGVAPQLGGVRQAGRCGAWRPPSSNCAIATYTLQRAVEITRGSIQRLAAAGSTC